MSDSQMIVIVCVVTLGFVYFFLVRPILERRRERQLEQMRNKSRRYNPASTEPPLLRPSLHAGVVEWNPDALHRRVSVRRSAAQGNPSASTASDSSLLIIDDGAAATQSDATVIDSSPVNPPAPQSDNFSGGGGGFGGGGASVSWDSGASSSDAPAAPSTD